MRRRFALLLSSQALGVLALSSLVLLAPFNVAHAADKPKGPSISAKVGKPLKAAQDAMQKQDWVAAEARIADAQALPDKTPFEVYQINDFLSFVQLKQSNYAGAAATYEAMLSSGLMPPEQVLDRTKTLTRLYYQLKDYPKVVDAGNRWIAISNNSDAEPFLLVGQSDYLLKNYADAIKMMRQAVDATRSAGKDISESWLQITLSSYDQLGDNAGVVATLEELVRSFPSQSYWTQLIGLSQRQNEGDDRTTLHFYRLQHELGILKTSDDYVEMAQLARDTGVPGEAVDVLEEGFAKKILEDRDVNRRKQLLAEVKSDAQSDQKALPALDTEAEGAKTGEADVALGIAYLSYHQPEKAVGALRRGLQKGGLKRPEETQITLGRALLKLNQKEEAVKAFQSVPATAKLARVATLWAIYAQQQS